MKSNTSITQDLFTELNSINLIALRFPPSITTNDLSKGIEIDTDSTDEKIIFYLCLSPKLGSPPSYNLDHALHLIGLASVTPQGIKVSSLKFRDLASSENEKLLQKVMDNYQENV
ncbi:MAG: hypothetical protein OJI67_06650 [Prosthecobacter sp.]|nr:hypothetical protein [Prosthecobacter sp.]